MFFKNLSHLSRVHIFECLHQFPMRIHDKWTIRRNWLIDRLSWHNKNFCICSWNEIEFISFTRKVKHITIFDMFPICCDLTLSNEYHEGISVRKIQRNIALRIKSYIIEFYRRVCLCDSFLQKDFSFFVFHMQISCYHSSFPSIKVHFSYIFSRKCLISRSSHLVLSRKINPELYCMLDPTHTRKFCGHLFFMEKSASCCHPLHFIWPNDATMSGSISMFHFTTIDDGYCFKASMWMKTNSWSMPSCLRRDFPWSIVVEHEKWTRFIVHLMSISWDILRNAKSISYHMWLSRMFKTSDFFIHEITL